MLCSGDDALRAFGVASDTGDSEEDAADVQAVAARIGKALAAGLVHVEPQFVAGSLLSAVRDAAHARLASGHEDHHRISPPLGRLLSVVERLRRALAASTGRALLESAEIQLLGYKPGGSYRRHLDDSAGLSIGTGGRQVRRSLSLLIYLTPDDWNVEQSGGSLRVHLPGGGQRNLMVDVPPLAGSLVVFDSATVPHEVLRTQRPRVVLAGWLQEVRQPAQS